MATLFAPPGLFSAFSYAIDGTDPDLRKGTHLRVFAGIGASFPLRLRSRCSRSSPASPSPMRCMSPIARTSPRAGCIWGSSVLPT